MSYYLIHQSGHDDPVPMAGPYDSYGDALDAYRKNLIDSGADVADDERTEDLYLTDDSVQIGRVYLEGFGPPIEVLEAIDRLLDKAWENPHVDPEDKDTVNDWLYAVTKRRKV